ncbi:phospholipase D family protein [Leeuwenhoekiella aequorea]|uniref:phospholipase D family protein n=1 Tax=Leeuwenhoekiella aequorea TaxID=283736 RepID=UPI00352F7C14|tara:strand:- start:20787 stop:22571 length:1785 start_codon:yes stop_codon:yes gene_type:complete
MLDLKKNRLNYGKLLSPPEGYELERAIGTTYSLDLFALLAVPVALFYSKSLEGNFTQNRYDVLESIRQCKDKVVLYCQRGKIKVPDSYNKLLAFVEDCIVEVTPPIVNASFHPKLWVLRFINNDGDILYRVIVLSRNLTFDRSWDIAGYTEGKLTNNKIASSSKLSNFLKYFIRQNRNNLDGGFLKDLSKTSFDSPEQFDSLQFHPVLGFNNQLSSFPNPLEKATFKDLLIISPFVDITTLKRIKALSKSITLISRNEELQNIPTNILSTMEVWCLNPLVVQGEDMLDSEESMPLTQNLHAKIYVGQTDSGTSYFLGSANCTDPAFTRNAECMIQMDTKVSSRNLKNLKEQLLNNEQSIFQPYKSISVIPDEEKVNLERLLREINYSISNLELKGIIEKNESNQNFNLVLKLKAIELSENDFSFKIGLIHRKLDDAIFFNPEMSSDIIFENIAITNLSSFIVIGIFLNKILKQSLLVKMDVLIPVERNAVIFNNLISSKIKFFQYLQFLLAPDDFQGLMEIFEDDTKIQQITGNSSQDITIHTPIYEHLLLAASRTPKKLAQIDKVIEYLKKQEGNVVEDFLPLWNVFKEFIDE